MYITPLAHLGVEDPFVQTQQAVITEPCKTSIRGLMFDFLNVARVWLPEEKIQVLEGLCQEESRLLIILHPSNLHILYSSRHTYMRSEAHSTSVNEFLD